ncbi:hypothetical protein BV25DRAFT_770234 [Artomyces pyxidatus]|nr:hypothetical protein BV25DRAFT_770234 [Artomyces pyxidatus]
MLWLRGKPGAGKTSLASIIIEALKASTTNNPHVPSRRAVAYFYCQHDDPRKRDPLAVLPSLLHDVLEQLPLPSPRLLEMNPSAIHARDEVCTLLDETTGEFDTVFLIVDALDECAEEHRGALVNALRIFSRHSKVLITSRDWTEFRTAFKNIPVISLDTWPDSPDSDIVKFIRRKVKLWEDGNGDDSEELISPSLKVRTPELRDWIIYTLEEGADGMFLWVRLQILHLRAQATEHDIIASLNEIPKGLDTTYNRALRQINALPDSRRVRVQRLLRWLVCSFEPFSLEALVDAVVIDDMPLYTWDPDRCITDPCSLIDDCHNLVVLRSQGHSRTDGYVQLIHASVRDFLLGNPQAETGLAAYHFDPGRDETHSVLASNCVDYILQTRSAHLPVITSHPSMLLYAQSWWGRHIVSCPSNNDSPLSPLYPPDTYLRRMFPAGSDFSRLWYMILNGTLPVNFQHRNRQRLLQFFTMPDQRLLQCCLDIAPGWISLPAGVFDSASSNTKSLGGCPITVVDRILPDINIRVVPQR